MEYELYAGLFAFNYAKEEKIVEEKNETVRNCTLVCLFSIFIVGHLT